MSNIILNKIWLHGTDTKFNDWEFPPPFSPTKLIKHTGIFFTTNIEFAQGAGGNIAEVEIKQDAKILNTLEDRHHSEQLRVNLCKNPFFDSLLNSLPDIWHNGWIDGSVLRPIIQENTYAEQRYHELYQINSLKYGSSQAQFTTGHQLTRELIELICLEAKMMKFDGIYGHEIDRWTNEKKVQAQPWLCIFNKQTISNPKWIV